MDKLAERVAALEATMTGKLGVLERLIHLDECVDRLKVTVWKATGAFTVVVVFAQWLLK